MAMLECAVSRCAFAQIKFCCTHREHAHFGFCARSPTRLTIPLDLA